MVNVTMLGVTMLGATGCHADLSTFLRSEDGRVYNMTFVTRLTLQSGDRIALDRIVSDIKGTAERKGAALKGPHTYPPKKLSVPQHRRLHADDERMFSSWKYTVFTRELEIHGHENLARTVTEQNYPDSVHIEVEVEQIRGMGQKRT